MRNHTSYGKNIAVISIVSSIESTTTSHKRVSEEVFVAIEAELMKVNGISAVLAVYGKERFMSFTSAVELDEDVTFVASLILAEGIDIRSKLADSIFDPSVISSTRTLLVKSHYLTDTSTLHPIEDDNFTRRVFEDKLLMWKERSVFSDELIIRDDSSWYDRGSA